MIFISTEVFEFWLAVTCFLLWIRWEEEKHEDGVKWKSLEHKGPVFAAEYEPLPKHIKFKYNGKEMKLTQDTEEVASFYGHMLDHDYTTKEIFNKNFFKDWRKFMTQSEKEIITDLSKCDFTHMNTYFKGIENIRFEWLFKNFQFEFVVCRKIGREEE